MPRGIPKTTAPKTDPEQVEAPKPAKSKDRIEAREDEAVGREVYDVHYAYNGSEHVQPGFLSELAARSWLAGIKA
jgi:hypothetical protein